VRSLSDEVHTPGLEGVVPDDALLLLGRVLPRGRLRQVHQRFGVEEAEAEAAVDHQAGAVPLPARVVGQGVELRGPDHDVLQVPPGEVGAEGRKADRQVSVRSL